ncbi:MAG: GNAT family N-acetyltransferase [Nitrososphaerota archaeon]|nr:GNAT family N-acetyltransferase [Nitrososphaerota archaeon]MDG6903823.1 GNAT family N-acetyltransferase [Nitrososphaerota archaeon]MDG6911544.1 GNAT family N-acetyltransferase [Nitrososphaerota archaeon]MDG6940448.1 GNAT family N-acetyltransferase [Nitrososphaerota archaeon]MDG6960759.1 GNAT family N-acetyltransferase [Nitrososphaerota archaeon]
MAAPSHDAGHVKYMELRKQDLRSFEDVVVQGLGHFERVTCLDEPTVSQLRSLRQAGVWTMFSLLRALGRAPINIHVAVTGGKVIGTASEVLLKESGYVLGVATDVAMRNRGIATNLLERIHADVGRKGKTWTALDVESDNAVAVRVYKRLGYEEVATFAWHVGPLRRMVAGRGQVALVERNQLGRTASWVQGNIPPSMAVPLPPSGKRLTHLELLVRAPGSRDVTWEIGQSGQKTAAVRGIYTSMVKTGYIFPVTDDRSVTKDDITAVIGSASDWVRSLGGSKMVVATPSPSSGWNQVLTELGILCEASTTLMVRKAGSSH